MLNTSDNATDGTDSTGFDADADGGADSAVLDFTLGT